MIHYPQKGLVLQKAFDSLNRSSKILAGLDLILDGLAGVQHRRMIFLAHDLTDIRQGTIRVFLRQIHRDLTCLHDLTLTRACLQQGLLQIEILTDGLLNRLYRKLLFL